MDHTTTICTALVGHCAVLSGHVWKKQPLVHKQKLQPFSEFNGNTNHQCFANSGLMAIDFHGNELSCHVLQHFFRSMHHMGALRCALSPNWPTASENIKHLTQRNLKITVRSQRPEVTWSEDRSFKPVKEEKKGIPRIAKKRKRRK